MTRRTPSRPRGLGRAMVVTLTVLALATAPSSASGSGSLGAWSALEQWSRASTTTPGWTGRWSSGAFLPGLRAADDAQRFGQWRGRPVDALLVYPSYTSWRALVESTWVFDGVRGFDGTLVYGLPLLPSDGSATLADVAAGEADAVFAQIADQLRNHDQGGALVRVGWEANGGWFPWGATAATAADFRAAARRVMAVMSARTPSLRMGFDITCSGPLEGSSDRLAALRMLHPGDDLTDVVGCDHYDAYSVASTDPARWQAALRSPRAPGLQDVADFARSRGKSFAVPEWGVWRDEEGAGDNARFIRLMRWFFEDNADVLALEAYFNEPAAYISSALWTRDGATPNPRSAEEYRRSW